MHYKIRVRKSQTRVQRPNGAFTSPLQLDITTILTFESNANELSDPKFYNHELSGVY